MPQLRSASRPAMPRWLQTWALPLIVLLIVATLGFNTIPSSRPDYAMVTFGFLLAVVALTNAYQQPCDGKKYAFFVISAVFVIFGITHAVLLF